MPPDTAGFRETDSPRRHPSGMTALAITAFVASTIVLALRRTQIPVVGRYFQLRAA